MLEEELQAAAKAMPRWLAKGDFMVGPQKRLNGGGRRAALWWGLQELVAGAIGRGLL